MTTFNNPFFWALVSMFGLVGANAVVSGQKLGKYPLYGWVVVTIFSLGRILLVLPFCEQHRFEMGGLHQYIGSMIFVVGIILCIPAFLIKPVTTPDTTVTLRTNGFYKICRNPIYLGEILWCLGWSIMFRSTIGISLVPFWWIGLLIHTIIEEESLERELGQSYLDYKKHVRGRIIPGLPI